MPLVPAVETALRCALGDASWRVRHAAARALYAADVARSEAVATLVAGPRGVPGSALREAFSLDPQPPEILASLWSIGGRHGPRAPLVPFPIDDALSRLAHLVRRGHPVPAGFLDALWARVVDPAGVPDRWRAFRLYVGLAPQDPASAARLVGLLDHPDESLRAAALGVFAYCAPPPEALAWIEAGLGDPSRRMRAFELLDAIWRLLESGPLRAAAGDRLVDALLAARAEPDPAHRALVIGALAGWVSERADVEAAVGQRCFDALVAEGAPALAERLASPRGSAVARVLAAIERLGASAAPAAPAIVALLDRTKSPRLRRRAVRVLGSLGPDAQEAVTTLIPLLHDPSEAMRATASRSLGRIGVVVTQP